MPLDGVTELSIRSVHVDERDEIDNLKSRLATLEVQEASAAAAIADGSITNAKLRDSAALSVIGRSANSSGVPADIAAGTDGHVLRRSGTSLGFGTIATGGVADAAISNAKLANMTEATVKGRASGAGTGAPADLSTTQLNVLVGSTNLFHAQRIWSGVSSDEGRGQTGTPPLTVKGNSLLIYRESADSQPPHLEFLKRRSGSGTAVNSGDMLGSIVWTGADTTTFGAVGAIIRAEVDGTPGSADMPGRIIFLTTPDGSGTPAERMRIANSGDIGMAVSAGSVGVGTNSPQRKLHILDTNNGALTLLALDNTDTTNDNGCVISFRTTTTGTGGAAFQQLASIRAQYTVHNHATRSAALAFITVNSGTSSEKIWISPGGNVGLSTTSPGSRLHVVGTNDDTGGIRIESSAGTAALRGAIYGRGNVSLAMKRFEATGAFQWIDSGDNVAMVLDDSNNLGVGANPPSAKLHVNQGGASAGIPALTLVQADTSMQMIAFNSTVGTGNAIEAVGSKTLTTTHFIRISITGVGFRYIPVGTIA